MNVLTIREPREIETRRRVELESIRVPSKLTPTFLCPFPFLLARGPVLGLQNAVCFKIQSRVESRKKEKGERGNKGAKTDFVCVV